MVSTDSRLLFQALDGIYDDLGFDALGDDVFRDLVLARVIEPTSILDTSRCSLASPPDGWTAAHALIEQAGLVDGDIVFDNAARLVTPTHTPDRASWCLHVDAVASPKLPQLIRVLRAEVPTPGERADHEVLPHVTLVVLRRV